MSCVRERGVATLAFGSLIAGLLATGVPDALFAQDGPNTITVSMGRSRQETFSSPTEIIRAIGTDYMRRVSGPWELGLQLDLDFDRDGSGADAFLATPVLAYAITPRWPVFAGAGVAFEPDHTHVFARVGTEIMFPIGKKGFFVGLGTFLDISESATPSVMLALGRVF